MVRLLPPGPVQASAASGAVGLSVSRREGSLYDVNEGRTATVLAAPPSFRQRTARSAHAASPSWSRRARLRGISSAYEPGTGVYGGGRRVQGMGWTGSGR